MVVQEAASCRIEIWSKHGETLQHEPRKTLIGHAFQVIDLRVIEEVSFRRLHLLATFQTLTSVLLRVLWLLMQEDQLISSDYSGELRIWDLASLTIKQTLRSRACDRRMNPLTGLLVLGPSKYSKDTPWTIMLASKSIEVWMKARLRQRDHLVTSFYNANFREFVLVGTKRIFLWDGLAGGLNKTYDGRCMCSQVNGQSSRL